MSTISAPRLPDQFGRYRIVKIVGEGGMGAVYLARDTQLDRDVALKVPQFADGDASQLLERFYQEARAAATVFHPNICPIYDVGAIDGVHYLSMAFIDGVPLEKWAVGEKTITIRQIAVLVRKIAVAMNEAHKKGVVHRDLKPANIMIDRRGEPIVMDFGLARRAQGGDQRLTQSGAIMGSPAYMAPEQVKGQTEAIGPACDIYGLGVILYELLTNRPPFVGADNIAVLAQVLMDQPTPPSKFRPDLDAALEAICLLAMAKKPADRFTSMADFADALQDFLRGSPRQPKPVSKDQSPTIPPAAAPTQPPGIRISQMGGLRSFAKLQAAFPSLHRKKSDSTPSSSSTPSRRRRRKQKKTGVATWVWFAAGAFGITVLTVILALVLMSGGDQGTIRIDLDPASAQVEIRVDGKPVQRSGAELQLPAGAHELMITSTDFDTERQTVTIQRGANPSLHVALRPKNDPAEKPHLVGPGAGKPGDQVKLVRAELPKTYRNVTGMDFVLIPKGKSWLGGKKGRPGTEFNQEYDFYLGKYLVTQEEWQKVMGKNPSTFSRTGLYRDKVQDVSDADLRRFPVDNVTWIECQEFVTLLNRTALDKDWVFRLPTKDEWEYACRGGPMADVSKSEFEYYLDAPTNELRPEQANFGDRFKRPTKVGSYQPNSRGLYDMHGNLWEYCDDELKNNRGQPTRIAKGGAFMNPARLCAAMGEVVRPINFSDYGRGLRVARVPANRVTTHAPVRVASESEDTKKKLDDLMESYRGKTGASAAVLAIERDGVALYTHAYGFRDKENRIPASIDTMFSLGYGSASLAHASIRKLVEQKKLNPDDSLLKYLNIKPLGKVADKNVWTITVQNAIDGVMGWDNDTIGAAYKIASAQGVPDPSGEFLLTVLARAPLKLAPGARNPQSLTNPVLFALIAKASGKPAFEYVHTAMLGKELAGIGLMESGKLNAPVYNAAGLCVTASALLEFMRKFSPLGGAGLGPGARNWWSGNTTGHMIARPNRMHAVVIFNGNGNDAQPDFLAEFDKLIDSLIDD